MRGGCGGVWVTTLTLTRKLRLGKTILSKKSGAYYKIELRYFITYVINILTHLYCIVVLFVIRGIVTLIIVNVTY